MIANEPEYPFASHLKERFEDTADWRERLTERFPQDYRIVYAVTRLKALASLCEEWKADAILKAAWQSVVSDNSDEDLAFHWNEIENELLRSVGFHFFPDTIDDYVNQFRDRWSRRISS